MADLLTRRGMASRGRQDGKYAENRRRVGGNSTAASRFHHAKGGWLVLARDKVTPIYPGGERLPPVAIKARFPPDCHALFPIEGAGGKVGFSLIL